MFHDLQCIKSIWTYFCFRYFHECWLSQKRVSCQGSKEKQPSRQRRQWAGRLKKSPEDSSQSNLDFSNSQTFQWFCAKNNIIFLEPLNQAQVEVLRQEATLCDLGGAAAMVGCFKKIVPTKMFAGPVYGAAGQSKSQPGDLVRLKSINLV